jgi:hypothetical protein
MDVAFTDRRMEWHAHFKERNNADGRLASRPKGSPLRPGPCVAKLNKGLPLPAHCAPKEVPLGCALTPALSGLL